jgi:translocation and assembly module TamB
LTTSARASAQGGELTVTDAAGKLADVDFTLNGPAHIHRSGADYTLDPVAITAGKGRAEMAIRGTASEIHSTGNWKDFPLSLALLAGFDGIEGTSSGSLSLDGPLQSPACRLDVRLTQLRNTALDHGPGVDISIKADHDGQWTTAEANATLSDAAKTLLSARLPVNLSLSPPRFALREQDNLQADAELTADLPASAALMDWTNDLPRGIITGKFRLAGTMAVPRVSGELNLEDGGYENLRYGAIIKNLRIRLVADGSTVRIEEFTGTDGESGKLSATGQMEVSFARKHPFRADVTLDRMRSLRTEYGTALLSGKLQFAGDMGDSTLKGAVTIQEGDFRLPDRFSSAKAPEVEYTDKDAPQQPAAAPSNSAPVMPTMALDLAVSVPGRVYLRAPVLETEWNGDLHLRGTLNEPRTEGTLRVIRGYLDLIGQRFALTDSNVGFINGNMRAPYLNMTGVCMANDITARIQLSGPPSDAQLTLSSDPPMPQDEILSKLLFRKGVSQASPLQAIQVARTAAMFSDRLSLPQFLTGSVKLPGVDLFDIRTGEKVDKTVVGVGKYINDKIYVEAEQGASTDSGRVSAQVEVTPRVSVKADVGARNRGGVGIFWKKDY